MIIYLEKIDLKTWQETCAAMADNYPIKQQIREKYPDRKVSFSTSSCTKTNQYMLLAYEIVQEE